MSDLYTIGWGCYLGFLWNGIEVGLVRCSWLMRMMPSSVDAVRKTVRGLMETIVSLKRPWEDQSDFFLYAQQSKQ